MYKDALKTFLEQVHERLIVSCQALEHEPLHGAEIMARMALAAQQGGAAGIRANGPDDITKIRQTVDLPIIGLFKDGTEGVYITPTFDHARAIAAADVIALDGTPRQRPGSDDLKSLIRRIHDELDRPVLADLATLEEAGAAIDAGADLVAPTLAGYTPYTQPREAIDVDLLRAMTQQFSVPVIAEGNVRTPEMARAALEAGAWAVVVGGAITRPQSITARFVSALDD